MPWYEYECPEGHRTTKIFPMLEKPDVTSCPRPDCATIAKRVFNAAPVHFKGPGFYRTDGGRR